MKAKELKQDPRNYRKHSDRNKQLIKKSVDECGFGRSVLLDADDVLIAGNGVQSSIDPNTKVRIIETDGTELIAVKRIDLHQGDERRKLLAAADNATTDLSEWDTDMVREDFDKTTAEDWGVDVEWPDDTDFAEKNHEVDIDSFEDKVKITFEFNTDEWAAVNAYLQTIDANKEKALLKIANYANV